MRIVVEEIRKQQRCTTHLLDENAVGPDVVDVLIRLCLALDKNLFVTKRRAARAYNVSPLGTTPAKHKTKAKLSNDVRTYTDDERGAGNTYLRTSYKIGKPLTVTLTLTLAKP